jgi:hypothetical protein
MTTHHLPHRYRRLLLLMLPAALAGPPARATPSASEHKIIERLIQRIAKKGTMLFIRNDKEYDAADAAKHLQAKFDHFKERIVTAEDFIELCATRSEVTGQPYKVKLAGGTLRNASDFMNDELRHVRQEMRRTG